MEARDLASNLEFWSGRSRHHGESEDPEHPAPPLRSFRPRRPWARIALRHPRFRVPTLQLPSFPRPGRGRPRLAESRARPLAAALLLAGLTTAWLVAGHNSHAARPLSASATTEASPTAPASTVRVPGPTTTVPLGVDCSGLSSNRPEVRCMIDAVDVDIRLPATGTVGAAYRSATGADVEARSGPPACARGVPDERAWSSATSPAAVAGRYLCRFESGRAAMWWTSGPRLVHAVARDGDLTGLFSWWRAHPSE